MRKVSTWLIAGLLVAFGFSGVVLAAPKPVHSTLKVSTDASGEKVKISFSTQTVKDIVINRDPNTDWRLKILKAEGIDVPTEVGPNEYDDKLQGFVLNSTRNHRIKNGP